MVGHVLVRQERAKGSSVCVGGIVHCRPVGPDYAVRRRAIKVLQQVPGPAHVNECIRHARTETKGQAVVQVIGKIQPECILIRLHLCLPIAHTTVRGEVGQICALGSQVDKRNKAAPGIVRNLGLVEGSCVSGAHGPDQLVKFCFGMGKVKTYLPIVFGPLGIEAGHEVIGDIIELEVLQSRPYPGVGARHQGRVHVHHRVVLDGHAIRRKESAVNAAPLGPKRSIVVTVGEQFVI